MIVRILILAAVVIGLALLGARAYYERIANPRAVRELTEDPGGERAKKVMLLTLPSGRQVPVNYLREGAMVYAGADGRWWRELEGGDHDVTVLVRGETHAGLGRAVRDDPDYTKRVFARLRPNALPGFGTLVEIRLAEAGPEVGGEGGPPPTRAAD